MASHPPGPLDALLLVANDDASGRYLLARLLRKGGFRVLEADHGAEALNLAARARPDLVVLDVRLPDMSGYEVGRRLRADPATAAVGILYVSAHFPADASRTEAAAGDAYLELPGNEGELLTVVRLVLQSRRTAKPASSATPSP